MKSSVTSRIFFFFSFILAICYNSFLNWSHSAMLLIWPEKYFSTLTWQYMQWSGYMMQIMRHKGHCTLSYPCGFGWWQPNYITFTCPKNGEKTMTYHFFELYRIRVNAQSTVKGILKQFLVIHMLMCSLFGETLRKG